MQSTIVFALGKAYEDTKDYEKSFSFIKKANDLTNSKFFYDTKDDDNFTKDIQKFFDKKDIINLIIIKFVNLHISIEQLQKELQLIQPNLSKNIS